MKELTGETEMNNPGAEPRGIAARTNVAALNKL